MKNCDSHLNNDENPKPKSPTRGTAPPRLKKAMVFDPMEFEPMVFGKSAPLEPEKTPKQASKATAHSLPTFKSFSVSLDDEKPALETPVVAVAPQKQPQLEVQAKPKRMRITPYDVAHLLIKKGIVVSAAKLLHFFNGKAFQPYRDRDAEKKIVENCREAVAAEGRPSFARQVCQTLLQEPDICRDDQLHLNVVALDDGLLDLNTFTVAPHTPGLFVTTQLHASYDKGRKMDCPEFKRFLEVVSNHDPVLQRRIWQAIGYLLAPDQTGKAFFLLQGVPNSGKTVLGNFIRSCFVGDVVSALDINELGGEFALSDLVGKKLCVDFDLPADPFNKRAVSKLKKLTGGDPTSSNVKFADRVKFVNTAKLLFATNHAAIIPNQDEAFFDRMVVIPFTVSIPREVQDRQLPQKLEQERDAIIVQALNAYRDLAVNGYVFAGNYLPNSSIAGKENLADVVANFLTDFCEFSESCWTPTERIYTAFVNKYGSFCNKNEFSKLVLRLCTTLYPEATRRRSRVTPSSNPTWGFQGLNLKEDI